MFGTRTLRTARGAVARCGLVVTMVCAASTAVEVGSAGATGNTGGVVTSYTGTGIKSPFGIVTGSDGALWFDNTNGNSIGRITTAGVVSNYTGTGITNPYGIAAGPDGALWFTNPQNNTIGRITTAGVVSNFTDPTISAPERIAAGRDGNLWFANQGNNSIGRITPAGVVSKFTGTGITNPYGIAAGSDGALWFTNYGNNSIGRITTAGVVTNFTDPSIVDPYGIAPGPDGNLWFTNFFGSSIGRITTPPFVRVTPASGHPGAAVTVSGAGFTPGETVNVLYLTGQSSPKPATVAVCAAVASAGGSYTCSGTIPPTSTAGTTGAHFIKAKGHTSLSIAQAKFTLT